MKNKIIIGIGFLLFISCNSKAEHPIETAEEATIQNVETAQTVQDAQVEQKAINENWESFWSNFTTALKNSDKPKLKNWCYLPSLGEQFFENNFELLFEGDTKTEILNVPSKNIIHSSSNNFNGLENAQNVMEVYLENSNYTLFFATIDGQYKLVYFFAAG